MKKGATWEPGKYDTLNERDYKTENVTSLIPSLLLTVKHGRACITSFLIKAQTLTQRHTQFSDKMHYKCMLH